MLPQELSFSERVVELGRLLLDVDSETKWQVFM
jgi:hypothetical protein